jgi:hypothetical protein
MVQSTDVLGVSRVNEAGGLATIDDHGELVVEEGIVDIELVSLPFKGERDGEDDADHGQFYNRTESLVEVNALLLRETMKHPTCFVAVERPSGFSLWQKTHLPEKMLAFQGGGARSQVSLLRRARYSLVIASSQLGSLSTAHEEEGTGEYLLIEAGKLSRSQGGTCMPEVLRVRCISKGTGEGACTSEGGGEGASEDGGEGVSECYSVMAPEKRLLRLVGEGAVSPCAW